MSSPFPMLVKAPINYHEKRHTSLSIILCSMKKVPTFKFSNHYFTRRDLQDIKKQRSHSHSHEKESGIIYEMMLEEPINICFQCSLSAFVDKSSTQEMINMPSKKDAWKIKSRSSIFMQLLKIGDIHSSRAKDISIFSFLMDGGKESIALMVRSIHSILLPLLKTMLHSLSVVIQFAIGLVTKNIFFVQWNFGPAFAAFLHFSWGWWKQTTHARRWIPSTRYA